MKFAVNPRNVLNVNRVFGLSVEALRWVWWRFCGRAGLHHAAEGYLKPRQLPYPLLVRLRGSSDLDAFWQIFISDEYAPLRNLANVVSIIDLGANVGYSSSYLLNCFPLAHVLAVEPDYRNLEVCRRNLKPYGGRAEVLHGAVWSDCMQLAISQGTFGDGREWATKVEEPRVGVASELITAWDVHSLIKMSGKSIVDLLKIDIEGAELNIFNDKAAGWLVNVRNLCIELHGQEHEEVFFKALQSFSYELSRSGELVICSNLRKRS